MVESAIWVRLKRLFGKRQKLVAAEGSSKAQNRESVSPEPKQLLPAGTDSPKSPLVLFHPFNDRDSEYLELMGQMHTLNKMKARVAENSGEELNEVTRQKIEQLLVEWRLSAQEFFALELTDYIDRKLILKRLLAKNVTTFEFNMYTGSLARASELEPAQIAEIQSKFITPQEAETDKSCVSSAFAIICVFALLEIVALALFFAVKHS